MNTATRIEKKFPKAVGDMRLYHLQPSLKWSKGFDEDCITYRTDYVIVIAVSDALAEETSIYPSYENGEIVDWGELPGSEQGIHTHEEVLGNIGYVVSENPLKNLTEKQRDGIRSHFQDCISKEG